MKRISEKDLKVNPETVAQLNSFQYASTATEDQSVYDPTCKRYSDKEGYPTCTGHTMGQNQTCYNCGSATICATKGIQCIQSNAEDTCNVTESEGVVCCAVDSTNTECCAMRPSQDICMVSNNCIIGMETLCAISTDCKNA